MPKASANKGTSLTPKETLLLSASLNALPTDMSKAVRFFHPRISPTIHANGISWILLNNAELSYYRYMPEHMAVRGRGPAFVVTSNMVVHPGSDGERDTEIAHGASMMRGTRSGAEPDLTRSLG